MLQEHRFYHGNEWCGLKMWGPRVLDGKHPMGARLLLPGLLVTQNWILASSLSGPRKRTRSLDAK
jgi:hypothetical protein